VAAGRSDPLDRGREVIDAVGQLHLGLGAVGRQDAQRRRGLVGAPRAGVTGGERDLATTGADPCDEAGAAALQPAFASLDLLVITLITPETEQVLPVGG